jgi:ABC-type Fe3+/spermidine/putrescine transport system ATPase subunit
MAAETDSHGALVPSADADSAFVRIESVSKSFGDVLALQDASLRIHRGEILTLLGPSGGGKTTLLNLVAGFLRPDSGSIHIDGRPVTDVPPYKREIGVLFQNYALFPHMNVSSNVGYGLKMRRTAKAAMQRRIEEVLALVHLTGYESRKPRQLSGGQQQRVALARALAVSPKVLLLDEPFSALDKNLRASMQLELKDIQRKLGVTTIFVTHDQSEALSLSDRIAVLSEGRICQVGTPDAIYRRPADRFVAAFVGDVNVFRARLERVEGEVGHISLGASTLIVPASSEKLWRNLAVHGRHCGPFLSGWTRRYPCRERCGFVGPHSHPPDTIRCRGTLARRRRSRDRVYRRGRDRFSAGGVTYSIPQITLSNACRRSFFTACSARWNAAGKTAGSSTRSP